MRDDMIDHENRDKAETQSEAERPSTRHAYATPVVIDLGDVRELTRGGGGSKTDAGDQPHPG
jgi:hypothetical protein